MAELAVAILYHAALGVLLAGLIWLAGGGWLIALRGLGAPLAELDATYAYPLGLLAALAACALFLLTPWLGLLGVALLGVPLVAVGHRRLATAPLVRRAVTLVGWSAPALAGLSLTLGFFLHGPSGSLDSNAFGDVVWYVAKTASARESLFPLRDLGAAGLNLWHAEIGPTLIGGTVLELPGTDPFLFQTSLLPAFLLSSLCCGFAVMRPRIRESHAATLALLAIGMTAYLTWFVESPPVTLALPLAFAIFVLARTRPPERRLAVVGGVIVLDLVLTKGYALVTVGVLLVFTLAGYELSRRDRHVLVVASLALVAIAVLSLRNSFWTVRHIGLRFTPWDALRGLRAQTTTFSTLKLAPALQLGGWLLLAGLLRMRRERALLVALVVSLVWDWTLTQSTSVAIGLGMVAFLAVLALSQRDAPNRLTGLLIAAAGACLASGAWFRDFGGVREALVASVCLGTTAFSGLVTARDPARPGLMRLHMRLYALAGSAILLSLSGYALVGGLVMLLCAAATVMNVPRRLAAAATSALVAASLGVAAVAVRDDDLRLGTYDTSILTTQHYDIWRRVSELVPRDGLVFTDMTGSRVKAAEGLDYYPGIAGRQIYLAGWYQSHLRDDRPELARRLSANREVLAGMRVPSTAPGAAGYRSYYAVVGRARSGSRALRLLYANRRFALYRIVTAGPAPGAS